MMYGGGIILEPGARKGSVTVPSSKSHEHRLLIANFLAGETAALLPREGDSADILATKRCLVALRSSERDPVLDCNESGSTLRFLAPIAAALGKRPRYICRGRLADRPAKTYSELKAGVHELEGNVSSQFVTGLLFALPLLDDDSEIRFTSPLESRGYVDMTLRVLRASGIVIDESERGFRVRGAQTYSVQSTEVEGDWSGAAFWFGMNALGSVIEIGGLSGSSLQPDRAIMALCADKPKAIDVSQFPDLFPVLAVVAAGTPRTTVFSGTGRLHHKESDRVEAMREMLARLGVVAQVKVQGAAESFVVAGTSEKFDGCEIRTFGDHRIAMAAAVAATRAAAPLALDDATCVSKSYPGFFDVFNRLQF